jgi:hypothetical protein
MVLSKNFSMNNVKPVVITLLFRTSVTDVGSTLLPVVMEMWMLENSVTMEYSILLHQVLRVDQTVAWLAVEIGLSTLVKPVMMGTG